MMDREGCRKKWSWIILKYFPKNCLEDLIKPQKNLKVSGDLSRYVKSVNYFVKALSEIVKSDYVSNQVSEYLINYTEHILYS